MKAWISALPVMAMALTGCGREEAKEVKHASAEIHPASGSKVQGRVVFQEQEGGVRVVAEISGLTPGEHGFHIHEKGDCSAEDASSAGGHFNPHGAPHAGPDAEKRHAGDLGNITAGEDGVGRYDRIDKVIKLNGPDSIVGRSVIVHVERDDYTTQPTGNAGARIGCGVIKADRQ